MEKTLESADLAKERGWHMRFFVTPRCNFKCVYCNPDSLKQNGRLLSTEEVLEIVQAGYDEGIRRIHWSGGEPTMRPDLLEIMQGIKNIGYEEQIITTNGWNLHRMIDETSVRGLTRANISLDSLAPDRYREITGMDCFDDVIQSIHSAAKKLPKITKIDVVIMRSNTHEIPDFIRFAGKINEQLGNRKIAVKFICLSPNNPVMLSQEGQEFFKREIPELAEVHKQMQDAGAMNPLERKSVEGDNPNCEYFDIGGVTVGLIAMPAWNYRCGGVLCKKLRITPYGQITACLQDPPVNIESARIREQISEIMRRKEEEEQEGRPRVHYAAQIGQVRFGKTLEPVSLNVFHR